MQNDSHFSIAEVAEDNVLIRRSNMRRLRHVGALLGQAEGQAKKMIRQASETAEAIEAAAWQEGYCQGLQLAAGSLASFMADYQQWSQRAEQQFHQRLSHQLHHLFSNASVLPDLLTAFCSTLQDDVQRITLILPEAWRKTMLTTRARLAEITPCTLDYHYHPHSYCLLKAGDQLIEFDAGLITDALSSALINRTLNRQQCRQLSADSLQHIKSAVNQHIDNLMAMLNESEERSDESECPGLPPENATP